MNKISKAFENKKALIGFLTAGDPNLDMTERMILAMADAGMDMIEIGIPFSDPITETDSVQKANIRALSNGCTTDRIFEMLKRVRNYTEIPIVFMTYINPVFTYGKERFMELCKNCGIDGLIIPDLPFEERGEIEEVCRQYDVKRISSIVPSPTKRLQEIISHAEGFIYGVDVENEGEQIMRIVRDCSQLPCAAYLGDVTYEEAARAATVFDAVVIGGAVEMLVEKYGEDCIEHVSDYVRMMKKSVIKAAA